METKDVIKFMDDINTVISFVEGALRMDEIVHLKLQDLGEFIRLSIIRGNHDIPCEEIDKAFAEDSLRVIYSSIAAKYNNRMEMGALSNFKGSNVVWSLAPVVDEKTLIEFSSPFEKDQQWFYDEIDKGTRQKGLL